jgi:hypothetical protein
MNTDYEETPHPVQDPLGPGLAAVGRLVATHANDRARAMRSSASVPTATVSTGGSSPMGPTLGRGTRAARRAAEGQPRPGANAEPCSAEGAEVGAIAYATLGPSSRLLPPFIRRFAGPMRSYEPRLLMFRCLWRDSFRATMRLAAPKVTERSETCPCLAPQDSPAAVAIGPCAWSGGWATGVLG